MIVRLLKSKDVVCDSSVHETAIKSIENKLNYLERWKALELIKFLVHSTPLQHEEIKQQSG